MLGILWVCAFEDFIYANPSYIVDYMLISSSGLALNSINFGSFECKDLLVWLSWAD